jgi:ubiquinone biosynthesis protein Coq4
MDTGRGFFKGRIARALLGLSNFIVLASSIINTAIMAYFIHWNYRRTHDIYNIVIVRSSTSHRRS